MTAKPLVSIIIPTYKRDTLLEKAIQSAINQTYTNIEIIVVDDNNPNSEYRKKTGLIIEKYKKNSMIKYIKLNKNSGGCVARNTGMYEAKGQYINFLDDDDIMHSNKIEEQVKKMLVSDKKLAVVGCYARIINEYGFVKRLEKEDIKGDVFVYQLGKNICTTSIALIDRDVCIESGGFEKIESSQEHLFFIKIFRKNPYYDYVSKELLDINHHGGERVSSNMNKPLGALALFDYVKKYFNELSRKQVKIISINHYENIIRAYLAVGKKKETVKYIINIIKAEKFINVRVLKILTLIILGLENSSKIKMRLNGSKHI